MHSFVKERDEAQRIVKDAQDWLQRIWGQIHDYHASLERTYQIRSARLDDEEVHLVGYTQAEWDAMHPEAAHRTNQ
jgi:hypothetical protein